MALSPHRSSGRARGVGRYLRLPRSAPSRPILVQKFGGSSLSDPALIRAAADRVAETQSAGAEVVVTVSAIDQLLRTAERIGSVTPDRELGLLICSGEQKAAALMCMALREAGVEAVAVTGAQAGIHTDNIYSQAAVLEVRPMRVQAILAAGKVPVICGAQGMTTNGDITFLGRGGSDTSAVALAAALEARACELYTDVPGVFSADPKVVPGARLLDHLAYGEMIAMCAAGCPKPATRAVALARLRGVPVHVRSSQLPDAGSWIVADTDRSAPLLAVVSGPARWDDRPMSTTRPEQVDVAVIGTGVPHLIGLSTTVHELLNGAGVEMSAAAESSALSYAVSVPAAEVGHAVRILHAGLGLSGAGAQSLAGVDAGAAGASPEQTPVVTLDRGARAVQTVGRRHGARHREPRPALVMLGSSRSSGPWEQLT